MCPGGKYRLKWQNGSEQREWTPINSLRKSLYKMYLGLQYHSKIFHGNLTQRTENHINILINEPLFLYKVKESNNILSKLTTLDMLKKHVLILHPFHSKNISLAFHIWTVFHNGFFFNPKTAINRRISTKAGRTLEGEKDIDRNLRRTIKNRATVSNTYTHKHTNLQMAKITQYVQHSHFSNTKKDKDTDALQWTASAGCNICQGKTLLEKYTHTIKYICTNLQMARIHQ